ncbi:MAG: hypothetical protein ABR525_01460 [Candidatus Limnocylindria bacterium]
MTRLASVAPARLWERLPADVASTGERQPGVRVRGGWISELEDEQRPRERGDEAGR